MDLKIEKDVPLIASRAGVGRPAKYPIPTMEVGDSFAVRVDKVRLAQNKIVWCIHYYREKFQWDRKFITRTRKENGRKVVRCWRVS